MIGKLVTNILEWAAGHHDEGRWSPVAIVFHWTMAAMVFFQLFWGWRMGRLPVGGDKLFAYELHFAIGICMLLLALGRFGWKLMAPGPINDADKPGWESVAARITHVIFYTCLFGLPLTGWAMVSATARDEGLVVFGVMPWPLMPFGEASPDRRWWIEAITEWMHWGLILSLLLMIPVHVGAAFKHHLIDRDDVFHGMLPIVPMPTPRRTRWQRRIRAWEKKVGPLARRLWPGFRSPPEPPRRRP